MFTGIIEEIGTIKSITPHSERAISYMIQAHHILENIQVGDSIAVNGTCLTVTDYTEKVFCVDMMPETVQATSLVTLKEGSDVNLERSLRPSDRIGGHFVTGHVDGTGTILQKVASENAVYYHIKIAETLLDYFILKGSVALDGISLTVFGVDKENSTITVSIIPHTLAVTTLGEKEVGDIVNIECDMFAKHIHAYVAEMVGLKKSEFSKKIMK